MTENSKIWVLSEGIAGTENQCLGIAEALGGQITIKKINLRLPWRLFSPYLSVCEGPWMLTRNSDDVAPPYPDVVIAGGRKAIGMARYIRRVSQQTVVCVVQNPRVNPASFDVVAAPVHDALIAPNVVITDGSPNRISQKWLSSAQIKWADALGALPRPRIAVLVGGNSKSHRMTPAALSGLIDHLKTLRTRNNASLMVTVSRRTPAPLAAQLAREISGPNTLIYDGAGENPYAGYLAHADYIVCTSDSASMLSDAATTGKPVFLYRLPGGSAKFDRLYAHLAVRGVIRDLTPCEGEPLAPWSYAPFDDSSRVAEAIKTLLQKRHS